MASGNVPGATSFGSVLPLTVPGNGAYFANCGDDLHVGTLAPIVDGYIGCIVIRPDGSRYVAQAVPDPLAQQLPD